MKTRSSLIALTAAFLLIALGSAVTAQFGFPGMVRLPPNDFTWTWGDRRETARRRAEDFSVAGSEGGFRCELSGRLSPASSWSPMDVRNFENDLRTSLAFIQEAANAMYVMDQQRQLDWATLDCAKPEDPAEDAEKSQQLEDKARERAERRRERRRAREASNDDG